MNEEKLKHNIAKNITAYRKKLNLTQAQLAEKLSYSDKAISKWERGDGVPDVIVLAQMCELFGITLSDMISDTIKEKTPNALKTRWLVTICSSGLVWLVSVIIFVIGEIAAPDLLWWLIFIYALPAMFTVLTVFGSMWANRKVRMIPISGLIWTICLSIFLTMVVFWQNPYAWMVFLIGIPIELLFIFFFLLKKRKNTL